MQTIALRKTHPNLFLATVIFGFWGVATGINFILTKPAIPIGEWKLLFGIGYLIFGSMKLFGAFVPKRVPMARMGMLGCMIQSSLIATMYLVFFVGGHLNGLQGALNYLVLGIVQLTTMSEPIANPLTMKE